MSADLLPLIATHAPATQAELAELLVRAYESATPVYPIGGGTALDYGVAPKAKGWGVSLENLARVVDYPARDMTITVEAGLRLADLQATLAREGQRLPIDAPRANAATIGGVVATNVSGARRFGYGTIRDYVIGISAVDGRGVPFRAGGRVVKNVAGYDFCKLLSGSLGTLAIISQLTLKVRPLPESSAWVMCDLESFSQAERLLAGLVTSQTTPAAVELLAGEHWQKEAPLGVKPGAACKLAVGFEGTRPETAWQVDRLTAEWRELGAFAQVASGPEIDAIWRRLVEFPASAAAPITLKASVPPSQGVALVEWLCGVHPDASLVAHAASGVIVAALSRLSADTARWIIAEARPRAVAAGGSLVVLGCESPMELTRQAIWGPPRGETTLMEGVKAQLDPKGLLNPGRFVYGTT